MAASSGNDGAAEAAESEVPEARESSELTPTLFLSHGGGPCFFMDASKHSMFVGMDKASAWARDLREATQRLGVPAQPKAIVIISAHWEEPEFTVLTPDSDSHTLLFDYYGFPPEAYDLEYAAPMDAELGKRVAELVRGAGFKVASKSGRGIDHGVFIPLKMIYPEANIPIVQLSLRAGLNPEEHLRVGEALRPLRAQGVLIVGSGQATHNLRAAFASFGDSSAQTVAWAKNFDSWLLKTCTQVDGEARERELRAWPKAPGAKDAHPREEHLIPLHVAVGAAGRESRGKRIISHMIGGNMSGASFLFE